MAGMSGQQKQIQITEKKKKKKFPAMVDSLGPKLVTNDGAMIWGSFFITVSIPEALYFKKTP